ncbi:MAG: hypothetical protein LBB23_02195 [Rickettsiales bacterium]|jgi:DNA replication and repair protein RecF|nr:hypothetical protein [Rickettsiales bacterium]
MITTLTLTNFRNHKSARISTGDARHIIVHGANGAGKTNILEAISFFAPGTGLRSAEPADIPGFGTADGFGVHAELASGDTIATASGRGVKINGEASDFAALSRIIKPIWLTPREDGLFYGAASDRRIFFDHLIGTFSPGHITHLAQYTKLMAERGAALRVGADDNWLGAIEENLAGAAAAIAAERVKYAAELNHFFGEENEFGANALTLSGWLEDRFVAGASTGEIETEWRKYLADNRVLVSGRQIFDGTHRTDFLVLNIGLNRPAHLCSTGQQKMILLSLALSHSRLVRALTGVAPIILLDEVGAHLDTDALARFLSALEKLGVSVWMTGVSDEAFFALPSTFFIKVPFAGEGVPPQAAG